MRKTNENVLEHYLGDYRDIGNQVVYGKNNGIAYTSLVNTSFIADDGGEGYCISENNGLTPKRNYKDTIFRMLFSDRKELLSLYNAINGTDYTDADELEITTLDNAIYMSVKNDVSCLIDMRLALFEQQSTVNPNIPLRDLDYVSHILSGLTVDEDIYSSTPITIPNPKFVVFYNGKAKQPAVREYRLSDAYAHKDEAPNLELIVTQININEGFNDDLMDKCKTLREYMLFVERVRKYSKTMSLTEAVRIAVDECIRENILKEFLLKNKAEVIYMSLFEYNEELHERTIYEEGKEKGKEEGHASGLAEGIRTTVSILRENDFPINKITEIIMSKFSLSNEEVIKYI